MKSIFLLSAIFFLALFVVALITSPVLGEMNKTITPFRLVAFLDSESNTNDWKTAINNQNADYFASGGLFVIVRIQAAGGPQASVNSTLKTLLTDLKANRHAKVLVTIKTDGRSKSVANVKAEIDTTRAQYGAAAIDGFYVDNVLNSSLNDTASTAAAYDAEIAAHIHGTGTSGKWLMFNPRGGLCVSSCSSALSLDNCALFADFVVAFDNTLEKYITSPWVWKDAAAAYSALGMSASINKEKLAVLVRNAPNATSARTVIVTSLATFNITLGAIVDTASWIDVSSPPSYFASLVYHASMASQLKLYSQRRGVYCSLYTDKAGSLYYNTNVTWNSTFYYILLDDTETTLFLEGLKMRGINTISLYNLGYILDSSSRRSKLRDLMHRARTYYGVEEIEAIAGSWTGHYDQIVSFQNASVTSGNYSHAFSGLLTEIEFWHSGNATEATQMISYMRGKYPMPRFANTPFYYSCYVGWLSDWDIRHLVENGVHALLTHAYDVTPQKALTRLYGRSKTELASTLNTSLFTANPSNLGSLCITPIFSAEGYDVKAGSEYFMGDWMYQNAPNSVPKAEDIVTWGLNVTFPAELGSFCGYQWFSDFYVRVYDNKTMMTTTVTTAMGSTTTCPSTTTSTTATTATTTATTTTAPPPPTTTTAAPAPSSGDKTAPIGSLLFCSSRGTDGKYGIYRVYLASGRVELVVEKSSNSKDDMNPKVSAGKRRVAFYTDRGSTQDIYTADLRYQSTPGTPVTPSAIFSQGSSDYDPVWGYFGTTTRTTTSGASVKFPNEVIYLKSNLNDGYGDIFRINADGSNQVNVLGSTRNQYEDWAPMPTPSGDLVYFTSRVGGQSKGDNIFVFNTTSLEVKQLTKAAQEQESWYPVTIPPPPPVAWLQQNWTATNLSSLQNNPPVLFIRNVRHATDDLLYYLPHPTWNISTWEAQYGASASSLLSGASVVANNASSVIGADPAISPDAKELFFIRVVPGKNYQLFRSKLVNGSGNNVSVDVDSVTMIEGGVSAGSNLGPQMESFVSGMTSNSTRGLSGGFLQVTNSLTATQWKDIVREAAQTLKFNTIIISTESWLQSDGVTRNAVSRSNLYAVLDEAALHNVSVFIGLCLDETLNGKANVANVTKYTTLIESSYTSINILYNDATINNHSAFAGVYLSNELWTPGPMPSTDHPAKPLSRLWEYVSKVSNRAKSVFGSNKKVLMSPFISDYAISWTSDDTVAYLQGTVNAFKDIFANSSVDVVLVQDGAGAMNLAPGEITESVVPLFLNAFKDACKDTGCVVWANVESFAKQTATSTFQSLDYFDRYLLQLAAVTGSSEGTVTFEIYNYLFCGNLSWTTNCTLRTNYTNWLQYSNSKNSLPRVSQWVVATTTTTAAATTVATATSTTSTSTTSITATTTTTTTTTATTTASSSTSTTSTSSSTSTTSTTTTTTAVVSTSTATTTTTTVASNRTLFPAGETFNSIGWCPCYNDDCTLCQNINYVKPWQIAIIVDMFDTSNTTIESLKSNGHKVICYISAGTWENWRPDKDDFPAYTKRAKMGAWAGEWWLDIFNSSSIEIIKSIMSARMDLGKQKGCQAFDFDNVDCAFNTECRKTLGKTQAEADQMSYNQWLAIAAHVRGVSVGLKNDLEQVTALEPYFDFAVNEQCIQWNECNMLLPFLNNNKAVFQLEYEGTYTSVCTGIAARQGSDKFSIKFGGNATQGQWWDCLNYSATTTTTTTSAPGTTTPETTTTVTAAPNNNNGNNDPFDQYPSSFEPQPLDSAFIIPAYFWPGGSQCGGNFGYWDCLIKAIKSSPSFFRGGIIIMNPNSGPGAGIEPSYVNVLQAVRAAEAEVREKISRMFDRMMQDEQKVPTLFNNSKIIRESGLSLQELKDRELAKIKVNIVGYTYSLYGTRNVNTVYNDIQKYRNWYNIDGFFIDETSNAANKLEYYQNLSAEIRKNSSSRFIVNNPGTQPLVEDYMGTADVTVFYETYFNKHNSGQWVRKPWLGNYNKSRYATLYHTVPSVDAMRSAMDEAQRLSVKGDCGNNPLCIGRYVYLTDDNSANPWDTVSSWFPSHVAALTRSPTNFDSSIDHGDANRTAATLVRGKQALDWLISSNKTNIYKSGGAYLTLDGPWNSSASTQCATFQTLLQRDTFHYNANTYWRWMNSTSPYAEDYYDEIVKGNGWLRILDLRDAQPGDLIVMKYAEGEDTSNTGHVMMIINMTHQGPSYKDPIVSGTDQWTVWVLDSSASYHGNDDTRKVLDHSGGIGSGVARLYTNTSAVLDASTYGWLKSWNASVPVFNETLEGYTWSTFTNSIYYNNSLASGRRSVIGRPLYNYFFVEKPIVTATTTTTTTSGATTSQTTVSATMTSSASQMSSTTATPSTTAVSTGTSTTTTSTMMMSSSTTTTTTTTTSTSGTASSSTTSVTAASTSSAQQQSSTTTASGTSSATTAATTTTTTATSMSNSGTETSSSSSTSGTTTTTTSSIPGMGTTTSTSTSTTTTRPTTTAAPPTTTSSSMTATTATTTVAANSCVSTSFVGRIKYRITSAAFFRHYQSTAIQLAVLNDVSRKFGVLSSAVQIFLSRVSQTSTNTIEVSASVRGLTLACLQSTASSLDSTNPTAWMSDTVATLASLGEPATETSSMAVSGASASPDSSTTAAPFSAGNYCEENLLICVLPPIGAVLVIIVIILLVKRQRSRQRAAIETVQENMIAQHTHQQNWFKSHDDEQMNSVGKNKFSHHRHEEEHNNYELAQAASTVTPQHRHPAVNLDDGDSDLDLDAGGGNDLENYLNGLEFDKHDL